MAGRRMPKKSAADEGRDAMRAAARAAVDVLVECIGDREQKMTLRLKAAETILDRVYGRTAEPLESGGMTLTLDGEAQEWGE